MKTKIAIYKDPQSSASTIYTIEGAKYSGWVRSTEWVDVEFIDRYDTPELVQEEVERIDAEIEKCVEDNAEKLKALKMRKTAVLSRVFEPTEVA